VQQVVSKCIELAIRCLFTAAVNFLRVFATPRPIHKSYQAPVNEPAKKEIDSCEGEKEKEKKEKEFTNGCNKIDSSSS